MKFLLDENVDYRLALFLESLGHDVKSVGAYDDPQGLLDHEVLTLAVNEQRILLTNDASDFGDLIFRQHTSHCGVILFRFKTEETNLKLKKERLHALLTNHAQQLHHFIVVTPQLVRIRTSVEQEKQAT